MGEMQREGSGTSLPLPVCTLLGQARVHQPSSPLHPILFGILEALFHRNGWLDHWLLVIEFSLQPLSPLWRLGWD